MAGPGSLLKERWKTLTGEQRIAVSVFGVVALVVLLLGILQVRAGIINPFTTPVQTLVDLREELGPTEEELIAEQKKTDTDGDGISDYDESTKYFTSPYIRDSDSDGDPDNIEIARGTDPNCPKGTTCTATGFEAGSPSSTSQGFASIPGAGSFGMNGSEGGAGFADELPPRDAAAIRVYLQNSGVSAADLANYTDAELLEAYDQAASGQVGQDQTPTY